MFDFTQSISSALERLSRGASSVLQPLRRLVHHIPFIPIGIALLVAFALAQLTFAVQAATQIGCGLCHVPAHAQSELAKTPHKDVRCLECHQTGDYFSLLEVDIGAGQNLAVQLFPWRDADPSRASVPDKRCLRCHADQMATGVVESNGVRMRHSDLASTGVTCQECHADASHSASRVASSLGHAACSTCHDGKTAGIECTICHVQQPARDITKLPLSEKLTHTAQGGALHGMGDLTGCPTCHTRNSCASCHEIPLPHDPNTFPFTHGKDAVAHHEACLSCHQQTFCIACHQMPMPHPADYLASHTATTDQDTRAACLRCHVAEDCKRCHDAHVHSPLAPDIVTQIQRALTTTTTDSETK